MSRFPALLLALPLVAVAGCQPTRPPSPAAQKLIDEQTMTGPVNTKVQARPFTYPVKSAELSLWDIKVFDVKDKENRLRREWKHFAQIPQQPRTKVNNTQVLMNGWIISKDGKVFLPQKPTLKDYARFTPIGRCRVRAITRCGWNMCPPSHTRKNYRRRN